MPQLPASRRSVGGGPGTKRPTPQRDLRAVRSRSEPAARRRPRGVRLLDVDPDLGAELDPGERERAQRLLVVPRLMLEPGEIDPGQLRDAEGIQGKLHAVMLVQGSLELQLVLAGRRCTRLVGPREIVLLDSGLESSVPTRVTWLVGPRTEVAALDARFLAAGQRWPSVFDALLARTARQAHEAFVLQAISQLTRIEHRLLAYFWWLADRYGRMRSDGVLIEQSFTHETLGRMVGAARPTVSLALKELADAGLLRAERPHGWLLAAESLPAPSFVAEPAGGAHLADEARLERETQTEAMRRPGRPRVLVVAPALALVSTTSFDAVSVEDEGAALYEIAREVPDLVLVDVREPAAPLSQLVQALRLRPQLRWTRLVLLGDAGPRGPSIQLLAAAHEYITESTDPAALRSRIEAQLALATARAALAEQDDARSHL